MKKILISGIRDDSSYINVLKKEGHVVIRVLITQIIPFFLEHKPDLVILGTCVSSDNGIDIMKEIREYNKEIKIIIIGKTDALKKELLREGANDFLVKPVSREQLLAAVNN